MASNPRVSQVSVVRIMDHVINEEIRRNSQTAIGQDYYLLKGTEVVPSGHLVRK